MIRSWPYEFVVAVVLTNYVVYDYTSFTICLYLYCGFSFFAVPMTLTLINRDILLLLFRSFSYLYPMAAKVVYTSVAIKAAIELDEQVPHEVITYQFFRFTYSCLLYAGDSMLGMPLSLKRTIYSLNASFSCYVLWTLYFSPDTAAYFDEEVACFVSVGIYCTTFGELMRSSLSVVVIFYVKFMIFVWCRPDQLSVYQTRVKVCKHVDSALSDRPLSCDPPVDSVRMDVLVHDTDHEQEDPTLWTIQRARTESASWRVQNWSTWS